MVSGCAFWISPSGPPIRPSPNGHCTVADSSFVPVRSVGTTLSSIAWKIEGTPAMTCTLPMRKPGAVEIGLSICSAPRGMRAMRLRASVNSRLRLA